MFFLAIRHLFSRKRQTVLILLGISLASLVYVVISGMFLGMQEWIIDRLLNNTAHIAISARDRLIDRKEMTERLFSADQSIDWIVPPAGNREEAHIMYPQGWFDRLREHPQVRAYAPSLGINVIISKRDTRRTGILTGIEPEKQIRVTGLEDYMVEGSLLDLGGGGNKLVAGDELLKRLGVRVGEFFMVSAGRGEPRPFKVVGALHLGVGQIDESLMFAALRDVQQLNHSPGRINGISINLYDMDRAQELADNWQSVSRDTVKSWIEANASFMEIFTLQDIIRYSVSTAILVVAGFGIYNVLSIMVTQKRREIAILRSVGFAPHKILELFLIQGVLLGFVGAILGLLSGQLMNQYIETLYFTTPHGRAPIHVSHAPSMYIIGFLLAFVSATLASILPAHAASKLTPIDIIRSE